MAVVRSHAEGGNVELKDHVQLLVPCGNVAEDMLNVGSTAEFANFETTLLAVG